MSFWLAVNWSVGLAREHVSVVSESISYGCFNFSNILFIAD